MAVRSYSNAPSIVGSVLLAQPGAFLQAYFRRTFDRLGVKQVSVAPEGKRALEMLSGGGFTLLLLDLELPEIGGLDLLEILRCDSSYDDLTIIVTTNNCNTETVKRALELGVSDFLAKPYAQDTVDQRILNAIKPQAKPPAQRPTILIAHRDRTFFDAVAEGFGPHAKTAHAHNLGVFLARTARCEPDSVVIEPIMFGTRLEFFLRSVRRLRARPLAVISVGKLLPGQEPPEYLGSIPDEREPEALRQSISALLEGGGALAAPGMPSRSAFISIIQQAFGMLAGIDVKPVDDLAVAPDADTVAVDLLRNGAPVWTLELEANAETALTVTADMMGSSRAAVDPAHSLRGLGEIARVVARRVRQIALESAIELEVGNPRQAASPTHLPIEGVVFAADDLAPFGAALGRCQPRTGVNKAEASQQEASQVYLLLFRGERRLINPNKRRIMEAYHGWISELTETGAVLANSGLDPPPARVVRLLDRQITEPARAESLSPILGCWMIEAQGDDQALDWARKLPFGDGAVEVRRIGVSVRRVRHAEPLRA